MDNLFQIVFKHDNVRGMTSYQRRIKASVTRALGILANQIAPANPTAAALITDLTTKSDAIEAVAATQDLGYGTVNGSVENRRILKARLVEMLSELAATARVLDPVEHPGVGGTMRMSGATNSYASLLARARAFHSALVPEKDVFVAYGSAATIDVDLAAAISALEAAGERKNAGRARHIGGTAGLAVLCKEGLKLLQKIDVIVSKTWKNDPALLAAWKAARRVERAPVSRVPSEEPTVIDSDSTPDLQIRPHSLRQFPESDLLSPTDHGLEHCFPSAQLHGRYPESSSENPQFENQPRAARASYDLKIQNE